MKAKMTLNYISAGRYKGKIVNAYDNGTYGTIIVEIKTNKGFHEIIMLVPSKINPSSSIARFMNTVGIVFDSDGNLNMDDFVGYNVVVDVVDSISKKDGETYSSIKNIELDTTVVEVDVTEEELPF